MMGWHHFPWWTYTQCKWKILSFIGFKISAVEKQFFISKQLVSKTVSESDKARLLPMCHSQKVFQNEREQDKNLWMHVKILM